MPRATVKRDTVRRDLKSCPGGYVELRQLSYDEMLERRDGGSKYVIEQLGVRSDATDNNRMAVQIANKWSNYYTFPRCVVSHNLTDEDDNPIDFSKPEKAFQTLDPKVGAEIEREIDALNQESDIPTDFTPLSNSSSSKDGDVLSPSTEVS
jgi:hypothetical protein